MKRKIGVLKTPKGSGAGASTGNDSDTEESSSPSGPIAVEGSSYTSAKPTKSDKSKQSKHNRSTIPEESDMKETIQCWTLQLETERERTKRQELKLTYIQESINLVKTAAESNIPPHLIPNLFTSEGTKDVEKMKQSHKGSTSVFKVNLPQHTEFQFHHWHHPDEKSKMQSSSSIRNAESVSKPQTPKRSVGQMSPPHRRNQSEASLGQFRGAYETVPQQIPQIQTQRTWSRQPQPQLTSPYQGQLQQQRQQQQQFISTASPITPRIHRGPDVATMGYQFPPPHQQQSPLHQGERLPGVKHIQHLQQQQPQQQWKQDKSAGHRNDVNFLISTPKDPPK